MKGSKNASQQHKDKASTRSAATLKSLPTVKGRHSSKDKLGGDINNCEFQSSSPTDKNARVNIKTANLTPKKSKPNNSTAAAATATVKSSTRIRNSTKTGNGAQSSSSSSTSFSTLFRHPSQPKSLPRSGECEICRQPCRSHCAGCKRVFYCSKQHQQEDWSNHKLTCRPFSIPTQYSSGFHLSPPGAPASSSSASFSGGGSGHSSNSLAPSTGKLSPELQFMLSTKKITAGSVLFTEKPLLVTANVFGSIANDKIWCCSCLKSIDHSSDKLNNNNTCCPKCHVPLCSACLQELGNSNTPGATFSKAFLGGQGHSPEECALIWDVCQKTPELAGFTTKCAADFMKDLCILRVLMFRTQCPWRWESLIALRNSLRFRACCKHNFGNLESWLESSTDYLFSSYYMKNVCKEKNVVLADIVRIVAVFCEASARNPSLLVLYENMSWLAHACEANTEQFFRQAPADPSSLEIVVKAVQEIDEGRKITFNYLPNWEGGQSALALRLFQSKGHYCCDTDCVCYQHHRFDKTMGIRCDLVFTGQVCAGILSPRLDAPNPDKVNLGLGMFMKSKKWECDKCKKSEKYESLHPKIMGIAQDLTKACDKCCNGPTGGNDSQRHFLQLQNKLLSSLCDQHWMVWKAKLRILKSWTASIGYGPVMLRTAVFTPPAHWSGVVHVVKQKVDLYRNGIYGSDPKGKTTNGVLSLFAKRHGQLSPKRGHLILDAFYANFIALVEDYKRELPLPSGPCSLKGMQVARENCKKLTILKGLLEETVESIKLTEGTTLSPSSAKSLRIAQESLRVLDKVCRNVERRPSLILTYLNEFLELYACQDPTFIHSCVRKSQPRKDPFGEGLSQSEYYDVLEFETEKVNLGVGADFTFGVPTEGGAKSKLENGSSSYSFDFGSDSTSSCRFGFSGFDSPMFAASDADSCSGIDDDDDDDDDNPFIYSRTSKSGRGASRNHNVNGESKHSSSAAAGGGKKQDADTDWSNYFWFDSEDDNDDDLDAEFDYGFNSSTGSPRSMFGGDLFNDKELDDLAEWAALQFMMGKMKM